MPHAAVWPALALAGGIAAGTWSNPDPRIPAGVLVLLTAASGVCLVRKRPLALFVVVIAGWTAAGVSLGSHAEEEARCPAIVSVLEDLGDDALLVVTGRLREDAAWVSSGVALSLAVDALAAGDRTVDVRGGVLLIVSGEPPPSLVHEWTAGRRLRVPATLRRPTRYHNDGVPDHRLASARRGTALLGSVKSAVLVEVLAPGTRFEEWAAAVRQVVRDRVAQTVGRLGTRSSAIVTAVLIGDRAGLDRDVQRRLQEAGTYHVIAISGGNIAIFAVLLLACSRAVRLPWRAGLAVTAAGLVAYGGVAEGGNSVSRAVVMALVYVTASALDQRSGSWSALAIAAGLILLSEPLALVDAGFQLTFGATIAIVAGVPRIVGACRGRVPGLVAGVAAASLASEIALLPIGAFLFARVTLAGLVLNLAAVPVMSVVQVGGLAVVVISGVDDAAARFAAWLPHLAAEGLVRSAALVEHVPWLIWRVPAPPAWLIAAYYALLAAWLTRTSWSPRLLPYRAVNTALSACSFAGAAVLVVSGPLNAVIDSRPGFLRITIFDVGQGDATLIRTPDGGAVLVDAGGLGGQSRFDIGERVVAPAVWAQGVRRLDVLVVSHGDPDHIGGAPSVLAMLRPREIWEGIPVEGHGPLRDLAAEASVRGVRWRRVASGDRSQFGSVTITVLHPDVPDWERQRVRNDDSVVLDIRYGEVSIVLPGDIGAEVEQSLVPLKPAAVRVLKVAHHGSRTSTSAAFVHALRPNVAIVSCGRENRYGHPVPEVLERLTSAGAAIYRTDRDGAVTIETDGRVVDVRTWRGDTEHDNTRGRHMSRDNTKPFE